MHSRVTPGAGLGGVTSVGASRLDVVYGLYTPQASRADYDVAPGPASAPLYGVSPGDQQLVTGYQRSRPDG